MSGAFVVDPPGVVAKDRIFVIGIWGDAVLQATDDIATINGKSWPYTERFTLRVGERTHWRWLNPSKASHAMHLHGFYYRVDAMGDGVHNQTYSEADRPLVVTQLVRPGATFDMTWVPERPGRWLFHCHMLGHMSPSAKLPQPHAAHAGPERAGMGGLVLGITAVGEREASPPAVWHAERKLRLTINERKGGGRPLYVLDLHDPAMTPSAPPAPAAPLIGPPIVLARGQPVEIEVVNHINQPTAIHWHGMELESYYDGVAGWTGTNQQTTPAIRPGESFIARMAPPRAGTFIYHTHWHERSQLENGIYGPLIVLPPGQKFDSANDKTFVFSMGKFEPFGTMLLINGNPQPLPLRLNAGTRYRFRLINIAPDNVAMRASLRQPGKPVQWRILAKDGADLPNSAAIMQTAELAITVGETYDFEYEATTSQELSLEVYLPGPKLRSTQGLIFTAGPPTN